MSTSARTSAPTEPLVRSDHQTVSWILQELCLTRTYEEVAVLLGMSISWVEARINDRRPGTRPLPRHLRRIAAVIGYDPKHLALLFRPPTEKS